MTRSTTVLSLILLVAGTIAVSAQSVNVSIQLVDRQIFYPDSDIRIRVTISNESSEPYQFELADRRLFTVDFDVRTLQNNQLPRSEEFTMRRTSDQAMFYREVTIGPGEEFSFTEPLDRYVRTPDPGTYIVQGRFFPDLYRDAESESIESNRLTLSVRPSPAGVPEVRRRIAEETGEILRREQIAPDEVVEGTIEARQRGNWDRFFLYIDLEDLLQTSPERQRRYQELSEADREAELEEFREDLESEEIDEDITTRPTEFEVTETRYTSNEATVRTEQRFAFPRFTEVKEYTYRLEKRDDVWVIYDYSVENLGTE
ncbi:MAG: hypothetical protein ACOCZ9_00055 [Spirochaetota bacterium]